MAAIAKESADISKARSAAPLVSVLISTFNRPDLLKKAIASVRAQSVVEIEILVRDDGGNGGAMGVLAEFEDARIVYRRNPTNVGLAATNILLYTEARGKYIAHLDDDDEWEPQFLARMLEPLERHPDVNLVFCNHVVVDREGRPQWARTSAGEKKWGRAKLEPGLHQNGRHIAAVARSVPTSHAAVVRRSALDLSLLDPGVARAGDMHVACLAVRQNGLAWFEPSRLSRYRIHEDQMSDLVGPSPFSDVKFEGLVYCLEYLTCDPLFAEELGALRRGLSRQRGNWALALLTVGRNGEALDQARAALKSFSGPRAVGIWFLTGVATKSSVPVGMLIVNGDLALRRLHDIALQVLPAKRPY